MSGHSDLTKRFLLATKRAEINALEQLVSNCQVVISVSELIHQLQKERGISNIFLSSKSVRFSQQRLEQTTTSASVEALLRSQLKAKYLHTDDTLANIRLLNCITIALQGLDNLPELRQKVAEQTLTTQQSAEAFSHLIKGLLSVVFEAADVAGDPAISQLLVALFNFIQAKEFAGQERALGAIGFAQSTFDTALCEQLEQLQQAQADSIDTFSEFASPTTLEHWQTLQANDATQSLKQMRGMIQQLANGSAIASEISEVWYELATQRIDQMRDIEEHLAQQLLEVAKTRVKEVNQELLENKKKLKNLEGINASQTSSFGLLADPSMLNILATPSRPEDPKAQLDNIRSHRSFYDLLREQSEHIKKMSADLDHAQQALLDQKKIDRAKILLMQELGYNEAQSHRTLQKRAMDQKVSLADMADMLIKVASGKQQKASRTVA